MNHKIKVLSLTMLLLLLTFCSSHREEPEFTAGASFRLASGGLLCLPEYDETSPQLVQHPNGFLTLLFVSNRPCNNGASCTSGTYNVFLSRSTTAYNGGRLPPFTEPLTVKGINDSMKSDTINFNIAAYASENSTVIVYVQDDTDLDKNEVLVTTATYTTLTYDSLLGSHRLLGYDPYGNKLFTEQSGGIFYTEYGSTPSAEPIPFNVMNGHIYNIAAVPPSLNPQGNAFFYTHGGVSMGTNEAPVGLPHISFMIATVRYLMDVREIAVLKSNAVGNEVFVFSGKSMRNGDNSYELYAVQDYNARQLWQMGMKEYRGFEF